VDYVALDSNNQTIKSIKEGRVNNCVVAVQTSHRRTDRL
jgi:hypothetical protein